MTEPITPDDVLTDDRIAAMRRTVMGEVRDDIAARRNARRTRTLALSAAATIAVVGVAGGVLAGLFTVGDSSNAAPEQSFLSPGTTVQGSAPVIGGEPAAPKGAAPVPGAAAQPPLPTDAPDPGATNRQVVTTGSVNLTAADPARAAKDLVAAVEKAGGRIDDRSESGTGDDKSALLTVRLPSDRVNDTVATMSTLGEVDSVQLKHEDVTSTVVDLDARIRATQLSVDRLTAILAQADTSDKVIQAEGALTTRQRELESLQSRRNALGEQVSLSTLTVSIDAEKPEHRGGFVGGLQDGWNALTAAGGWLLTAGGALVPWLALILVLYAGYRAVRRARS